LQSTGDRNFDVALPSADRFYVDNVVMRVHLLFDVEPGVVQVFRDSLPDGFVVTLGEAPSDTEILVSGRPTPELLASLVDLKVVIIPFAGLIPASRESLLTRPELKVYNLHHNAAATAEKAIELLMAVAKLTVVNDRSMRSGLWSPRFDTSDALQLDGRSVLVLGYGEIGKRVAKVCSALGMKVSAVKRRTGQLVDSEVKVFEQSAFSRLISESEVLMVCAPLTPETEGLVNRAALESMPKEGIVVNIGRGPIIEEEALYDCLRSGHLHGAGLDVWWQYPNSNSDTAPSKFPFQELYNVVMSPHNGGTVVGTESSRMAALSELVRGIHNSDSGLRPINVELGY